MRWLATGATTEPPEHEESLASSACSYSGVLHRIPAITKLKPAVNSFRNSLVFLRAASSDRRECQTSAAFEAAVRLTFALL